MTLRTNLSGEFAVVKSVSFGLVVALLAGVAAFATLSAERPVQAAAAVQGPVLLELFTSQGCSSCPPADRLAERLSREPGLVVVTRPVTYWDRLGWKDTLASPVNTRLQQDYDNRQLPGGGVFTPELVIDGQTAAVGSDEAAIRRLAAAAANRPKSAIAQTAAQGRGIAIGIAGQSQGEAEVVLIGLTARVAVNVGSGENGGRSLAFVNVYRGERLLGRWSGGSASFPIPTGLMTIRAADRYAVVVRRAGGGAVLAAALLDT